MSASMIRLPVPMSATMVTPSRAAAGSVAYGEAGSGALEQPAGAVQAAIPHVRPAWPDPGTINLAGELLDLSMTTMAYTASIGVPDTGADFWAMLATALPEGERD
ncbi:hypothetical protein WNZ14_21965 [Hoeflea sp. AS60]|uniref:hypothetical protein n=1 Tax=Hoeflea sp. AS60 TaxID=3135780 RepID=UPI00316D0B30